MADEQQQPPAPEPPQTTPSKTVSYVFMAGGIGSVLAGLGCALTKLAALDVDPTHYGECLALLMAGASTFSPGLARFKAGPMARTPTA